MQELRLKISGAQTANIEIIPTESGVEIVVHKQDRVPTYSQSSKKGKYNNLKKDSGEIIEEMKAAAREEYLKPNSDKEEIKKFVKFWEKKITENGWNGSSFNFSTLYEKWLSNKK